MKIKFSWKLNLLVCLLAVGLLFFSCSREKREIMVGRDATWFPKQFGIYTSDINAFLNDLVTEINYKENLNINIVNQDWVHLFENLDEQKTEGAFTSVLPTLEMLEYYQFSDPILLTGPVLVVAKDSPYRSIDDLKGRLIGVYKFDSSVLVAQNIPEAVISLYQHVPIALEALTSNCYDALLAPVIEVTALIETAYKGRLKIISEPLNVDGLRLVVLKGTRGDLLEGFNAGLLKTKRSGKYIAIKQQYHLP
ncbi:Glutamine-binding periplasmic protein precursor,glutamine ABC transporter periplasmic protein,lysine-arginine-ornithine-binding periplasmic protein,Bacterial extracellular solute-binding proteins, family 3 [Chlamydia serpentis]|uniref:Glutamine-binding periplasmic protein,glutamine ABC transporter periplasmic protein,lysine-arginine-ornithine-binding periplasmic protein,Bacterial extracellular solute-binding proteins, family 3 n=1 Tax=Chlamydia serpentis TaxID=1967782 RepID=A0A2R8FBD0_9CHLA|nr:transporter substrate-binding domain-containing protein [Chlamydia serpentis]SPN73724.1 Glutamine-binding periplasmic protein precursor,glutamine ABC transporter periplasmic protein,lysine-arginine-ornithine-binding periplasmic protein,Bacterial extracellular solute-binding proteins, family 3 [Chlamydia serpentis]